MRIAERCQHNYHIIPPCPPETGAFCGLPARSLPNTSLIEIYFNAGGGVDAEVAENMTGAFNQQ